MGCSDNIGGIKSIRLIPACEAGSVSIDGWFKFQGEHIRVKDIDGDLLLINKDLTIQMPMIEIRPCVAQSKRDEEGFVVEAIVNDFGVIESVSRYKL